MRTLLAGFPILTILMLVNISISTCVFGATEIPFKLSGHLIVVETSVDGLEGLSMVIDTGATFCLITPQIARRLHQKGNTTKEVLAYGKKVSVRESVVSSLRIGELEFREVTVRIGRLPAFYHSLHIDGLIGLGVLRRTSWTINYSTRKLIADATCPQQGYQSFYPGLVYLPVRLSIGGQSVNVMLDTGTDKLFLFGEKFEDRFERPTTLAFVTMRHVGGRARLRKVLLGDLSLGDLSWRSREAYLLSESGEGYPGTVGILGPLALGLKELHLDFLNNRISVTN